MPKKLKILVVGQTPPPYGGQAIMIDHIVRGEYEKIEIFHVRMCFSKEMNEKGSFNFYKFTHLFEIILKTWYLKFKHNIKVLYYPPSNAPKTSVYRDIIILLPTRFLFKKTIFHFHAAGLSEEYFSFNKWGKYLINLVYNKPELSVANSRFNPDDGLFFQSKINSFLAYGIPNTYPKDTKKVFFDGNGVLNILFVGLLNSTKGEGFLLEAVGLLVNKNYKIKLRIAGVFETDDYKEKFFARVHELKMEDHFEHLGVITGDSKNQAFLKADIFCFPSFFVSESLGVVILEAMQYKLPVIATRWRGIQSIVADNESGYLVDIKNEHQIADKIEYLINHPEIIKQFGIRGNDLFYEKYSLPVYLKSIEHEFYKLNS
ncbi:glycosyltransferase family 4 protein [Mucilaginibacter gilvus]|uniref:Glycosyltransferase n=1 Tax=Mucilaginibacter gilvus TaxID=2305909 RepID=A0A444MJ43_9SPHI|nr:glycosyltransferase family 4 protein [Mucilaginibacter gilvus]RWY48106.1 glycosyltransferase [Mucilaginibacter gilvus]